MLIEIGLKEMFLLHINFVKNDTRKFIQVDVIIKEGIDQTDQIIEAIGKHEIKDAVVKITYKITENLQDLVDIKKIQKVLNFKPKYDISDMLKTAWEWEKKN